jgi:hypothetical protein
MKDRKEIPRPQAAGEVSEAMTVKVYKNLSDVPFSRLWIHGTNAK